MWVPKAWPSALPANPMKYVSEGSKPPTTSINLPCGLIVTLRPHSLLAYLADRSQRFALGRLALEPLATVFRSIPQQKRSVDGRIPIYPANTLPSTCKARSMPASSTSRWVTARIRRDPIGHKRTPCSRVAAASFLASHCGASIVK